MVTAVAAAVLASLFTAAVLRGLAVHGEVEDHDRRIREIDEDMRRWVRDRDRGRTEQLSEAANQMAARGMLYSGAFGAALVVIAVQVREEWRNELSSKLREFAAIAGSEGRMHELVRRRRRDRPATRPSGRCSREALHVARSDRAARTAADPLRGPHGPRFGA